MDSQKCAHPTYVPEAVNTFPELTVYYSQARALFLKAPLPVHSCFTITCFHFSDTSTDALATSSEVAGSMLTSLDFFFFQSRLGPGVYSALTETGTSVADA
jgi:hypothetical protein